MGIARGRHYRGAACSVEDGDLMMAKLDVPVARLVIPEATV
jgi:hypothetical protein